MNFAKKQGVIPKELQMDFGQKHSDLLLVSLASQKKIEGYYLETLCLDKSYSVVINIRDHSANSNVHSSTLLYDDSDKLVKDNSFILTQDIEDCYLLYLIALASKDVDFKIQAAEFLANVYLLLGDFSSSNVAMY
jgi:hypothetical protein